MTPAKRIVNIDINNVDNKDDDNIKGKEVNDIFIKASSLEKVTKKNINLALFTKSITDRKKNQFKKFLKKKLLQDMFVKRIGDDKLSPLPGFKRIQSNQPNQDKTINLLLMMMMPFTILYCICQAKINPSTRTNLLFLSLIRLISIVPSIIQQSRRGSARLLFVGSNVDPKSTG